MIINGTPDNDDLFTISENDELLGFEGDDTLDASGGLGNNTLNGGIGNDELYANQDDSLLGDAGEDDLYAVGIGGNNILNGGDDSDRLFVVEGDNNLLTGDAGNDQLYVIEGSFNILQGGSDHDFLQTSSITGDNTLEGGEGDDTLIGYLASDRLFGDDGNDYLYAGKLGTEMTGGAGLDRFYFGNGEIPDEPAVVNDFTQGDDKVIIADIPQVQTFDDIILEQDGNNTLVKVLIDEVEVTFGILIGITAEDLTPTDFGFDDPSVFAIAPASASEGNDLVFTVTRSGDTTTEQTVEVSTSIEDGDTAEENDFTPKTETLTFAQGETEKTFTVSSTEDFFIEQDEKFTVSLNSATNGATISSTNGTTQGTINNDDVPFSFNNNVFTIKGIGQFVALRAILLASSSRVVNQLGVFVVDDEDGTINGIRRGEAGYSEIALERAKFQGRGIFSALGNLPDRFRTDIEVNSLTRLLGFNSGQHLQFFLVNGGTIDEYRAGSISSSSILFAESFTQVIEEEGGFRISWRERTTTTEFNSLVIKFESVVQLTQEQEFLTTITQFQGNSEGELIDLRNFNTVRADFSVFREAAFNNEVYFYRVDNETGLLGTLEATAGNQANYIQEAINRLIENVDGEVIKFAVDNQGEFRSSAIFEATSIIAPMIIVNGSLSDLLDSNTNNDPRVYFPFLGLNSDGADHIRMLGDNIFGFEDLPNGGDKDYNDVITRFTFTEVV